MLKKNKKKQKKNKKTPDNAVDKFAIKVVKNN